MEGLETAEKAELREVRRQITLTLRRSAITLLNPADIESMNQKHQQLVEKVRTFCDSQEVEIPEKVQAEFEEYYERLQNITGNQQLLEGNLKAQQKAQERIEELERKLELLEANANAKKREEAVLKDKQAEEERDKKAEEAKQREEEHHQRKQNEETEAKRLWGTQDRQFPAPAAMYLPSSYLAQLQLHGIPKFDGSQNKWPAFAVAVEDLLLANAELPGKYAVLALMQALEPDSEVYRRVHNLYGRRITLPEIWKQLTAKYSRTDRTEAELIEEAKAAKNISHTWDIDNIKAAYDCAARIQAVVENLPTTALNLQQKLISIFATKCHTNLQYKILHEATTIGEVTEILDKEWSIVERHLLNVPATERNKSQDKSGKQVFLIDAAETTPTVPRTKAMPALTFSPVNQTLPKQFVSRPPLPPICHYCQTEGHFTDQCTIEYSTEAKLDRILARNLCWNCLKPGHSAEECRSKAFQCRICGLIHKSAVHAAWMLHTASRNKPTRSATITNINAAGKTEDLKPVGIVSINNSYCMALIDTGADRTILAGALVKQCKRRPISPIWFSPYEADSFQINEEADLEITCSDGSTLLLPALIKRDYGPNHLIIGIDYLSTLKLPPIKTPFGDFIVGKEDTMRNEEGRILSIELEMTANELNDEAEEESKMEIRIQDNRMIAFLPFLNEQRPPNNFEAAERLLSRSLKNMSPKIRETYEKELFKYVEQGNAVQTGDPCGNFLPHFAVFKDSLTTKMRIVFNGSYGVKSLNDHLYKGMTTDLKLEEKLLKFRKGKYALLADIAKAFLQISINPEDQRYLKFMWKSEQNELLMFQFTSLPFGLVSSPAILEQCLKMVVTKLSEWNQKLFHKSIYMDDALLTSHADDILMEAMTEAIPIFRAHGFEFHKLVSNSEMIGANLNTLPGTDHHVLGLSWNTLEDTLAIKDPKIKPATVTPRYILHILGSLFDPIGLIDPVKLKLKTILSQSSKTLDHPVESEAAKSVSEFLANIPLLLQCKVRRQCDGNRLLGFSDASESAYGYCFYIGDEHSMVYFFGKAKIVPANIKRSTPELELAALYLMTRKVIDLQNILGSQICQIELYSDSQLNLQRLNKPLNKQKGFASSKLISIMKIATMYNIRFFHISGRENPADEYSRIISIPEFANNTRRYHRPTPKDPKSYSIMKIFRVAVTNKEDNHEDDSPLNTLIRGSLEETLGRVTRVMEAYRKMRRSSFPYLAPTRNEALRFLILQLQRSMPSKRRSFPTITIDNFQCVRTRIPHLNPIIIPDHAELEEMLIRDAHLRTCHGGRDRITGELAKEFFIQGLKTKAKKILRKCTFCTYARKAPVDQPLGYWPKIRTEYSKAFEVVALDAFGPIMLRNQSKVYGLICVCHVTRAIQVEVLPSLSASDLFTILQTMFCKIGEPRVIISDNGTNFRKVAKECAQITKSLKKLLEGVINWHFSPPAAPWFNASAERLIGAVKRILDTVDSRVTSHHQLRHIFAQAERIINNRTLFSVDGEDITPIFLWQQKRTKPQTFNPSGILSHPKSLVDIIKREAVRLKALWESNYRNILALQLSDKRITDLKAGQMVLVPDKAESRLNWKRGVILGTYPGTDGVTRVVELKIAGGDKSYCRPANGLILFEGDPLYVPIPAAEDVAGSQAFDTVEDPKETNCQNGA